MNVEGENGRGQGADTDRDIRAVIAFMTRTALSIVVGAALGAVVIYAVIIPLIGLGQVERIRALGAHLDDGLGSQPAAVLLGNSAVVEGFDASIVAEAAGDWHVENLAINGCDLTETRVQLGRVLAAGPDVVVLSYRCQQAGTLQDIPLDKAYAYALADFARAWPDGWDRHSLPGLSHASYDALRASKVRAWLHFRSYPLTTLNARLRAGLREGVRAPQPDNWTSPFDLQASIDGWRLERHLNSTLEVCHERLADGSRDGFREIKLTVEQVLDSDAGVLLAMVPVHPRLQTALAAYNQMMRRELESLSATHGLPFANAVDLVDEDGFADAVHLNARGRRRFSEWLGARLPLASRDLKSRARAR
jgi:hypothetical protein